MDILIRILRQMADDGATIIVVLHDMDHLRRLADEVLMLNGGHGRWVAPSALTHQHAPVQVVPFSLGGRHVGSA